MSRWVWALAAALAVGSCDRDRAMPEETPSEAPAPDQAAASPVTSIIRPEVAETSAPERRLRPAEFLVHFGAGGHALDEDAEAVLADVLEAAQLAEGWPVVLRGHTDSVGSDDANLRQSRRRAEAVAEWLVAHGIDEQRISVVALGEQRPIAPNAHLDGTPDEEGRAKNRRVTLTLAPPAEAPRAPDREEAQSSAES